MKGSPVVEPGCVAAKLCLIHATSLSSSHMKNKWIAACFMMALALGATLPASAAVVLNQIGDVEAYLFGASPGPTPSQIFTDFPSYDCTVLEDFTVSSAELRITEVSVLFRAQGGFTSFQDIQGYYLNFFSDPALAATTLKGDVGSFMISPGSGVTVSRVIDGSGTHEYGLVRLDVDIPMPSAGTYWVGVSPKAAVATGQFLLMNNGATGSSVTALNANGKLANPEQGFGGASLTSTNLNYAYSITGVPEPAAITLWMIGGCAWLCRRRRARDPDRAT